MTEKKPRRKKSLKVELENKVEEPLTESTQVEEVKEQELPNLDPKAKYEFVSNGSYKQMPKGSKWQVTGEIALIFLKRGYGSVKK